jgi:parvulin-like peptidyl-prolyl isomerase
MFNSLDLRKLGLLIFATLFWQITACEPSCQNLSDLQPTKDVSLKEDRDDAAAATVNDISLKKSTLDRLHNRSASKFDQVNRPVNADMDRKLRGSILRKMVDDELLRQKIVQEGIKVDRFERVDSYEKYQKKMGGKKVLDMFLKREGYTNDEIEEIILADLQKEKLIEKLSRVEASSEEEIKQHYAANKKLYTLPEMVRARHILLKLDPKAPTEQADLVLKKANKILEEALKPNVLFADLVEKYSEGPSLKQGGDLGFFPKGRMVKSFEDLAFSAPEKKAVGPVRTDFGYHIIFVEEKLPLRVAPLADVRSRIIDFLTDSKRSVKKAEIIQSLRKDARIKIYDYSLTNEEYYDLSSREQIAEHLPREKPHH